MILSLLVQGVQMSLVLLAAPLLTGAVRKVKARWQRRRGASVLQPYRDLRRLLGKDVVLAENASWLFRTAPYLIFAFTWVAASLVPTFAAGLIFSWTGDLIAIIALLGAARFMLTLAGMDIGTAFGGIGASREAMIAALAEPAMLMIIIALALMAGSSQLSTIAEFMASSAAGPRVSAALALVAFVIVALAENARIPVDNPATHLELTMVHEAMVLEYSGRHLAMIELAAALKLLLMVSAIACIFCPIGLVVAGPAGAAAAAPGVAAIGAYTIGAAAYAGKLAVAAVLLGTFESAIAKMRVFRVPNLLGGALMLGLLATLLLFVSRGL
jgi:formate hydrogenlyase subunit 4